KIIILTACECTGDSSKCYQNDFFYSHDFLELMKWLPNQFWIVVQNILINRRIVVCQAEKPCSTKRGRPSGLKDVFSVVGMSRANNSVTIQTTDDCIYTAFRSIPDQMRNPPPF